MAVALIAAACGSPEKMRMEDPVDYVNPLMGTASTYELSTGNTYPAIALPWGMNFWTPQTGANGDGWTYTYSATKIRGLKQTHQPSPWINDYGSFSIMPVTTGPVYDEEGRQSWFSHKAETVKPYYYQVYLAEHDVVAELAPTERAAAFRLTYPEKEMSYLVVDAYSGGNAEVIGDRNMIVGYSTANHGGVTENFRNWFVVVSDTPFETQTVDGHIAMVGFKTVKGQKVNLKVASSFISQEQAELNLNELSGRSFDEIAEAGRARWNEVLGRIAVEDDIDADGAVKSNPWRPVMDLSEVDFPYANLKKFENRIIYYESSRGCPFSCSYCLSSIDKRLRFRNLDLVKKELAFFLEQKVPQVKFVDRTFNCKKDHAMAIWKFIAEHDNGVTNFHFEIAADLITEEELELLNTLRPGLVQLEIGVQSTNPQTIEAIHRKMDFGKVTEIVNRIAKGRNIHQHLDLIAGLPYEDYASFRRSFADVYALRPQQLQLGFLKVLRGSFMYEHTKEYDCHYQEREPYEVLYTKWLPYDDVLKLKDVEEMVEVYYNSGQFVHTLPMIERLYENPFDFFQELGDFYRAKGYSEAAHNRIQRYEILLEFLRDEKQQDEAFFRQMMVLDLYARENMKTRPHFAKDPSEWKNESRDFYQKEAETRTLLPSYTTYDWKQLQRMTHVEVFDYDVLGNGEKARTV